MADQLVRWRAEEAALMRRAAARYSCSGGLADDRPMSRLRLIASGDSLLNYNVALWIAVIILMLTLLSIQMSNMSDLSLCQIP